MPNNWKTYNLGELVDLKQGLAINKKTKHLLTEDTSELPLFKINDLINNTVKHYVKSDEIPKQCIANEDELIYTRTGQVGLIFKGKKGCIHNNCFKIIPDETLISKDYIYWFLRQPHIIEYANNIASGSVQKDLNHKAFKSIEIDVPDTLDEQKAIASILSAIDDKIENNLAINKTLEDMAMALYKHWFVDFGPFQDGEFIDSELGPIPKGWEVKRLDEIIEIKRGGSPRPIKDFIADDGLHWLKISDATASNSPFLYTTKEFIKEEGLRKTILIKPGSIILSNSATPGLPRLIEFETCIHDGWLHFPKINRFNRYILYLLFLDIKEHLIQQGNGSVFTNLKTDILKSQLIKLPTIEIENKFSNQIIPWFEEIKSITEENLNLVKLRDTMLSKLISGEVRLKEFKEQIETVL